MLTEVSLADAVVAVGKLRAKPAAWDEILGVLGLTRGRRVAARRPATAMRRRTTGRGPGRDEASPTPTPPPSERTGAAPRSRGARAPAPRTRTQRLPRPRASTLRQVQEEPGAAPAWMSSVPALAEPAGDRPRLPREPLLNPQWAPGIVSMMLSTSVESDKLDVPRAVDAIARQEAFGVLPRLGEPTLRRGVQILVDVGASMTPFARDQEDAVDWIDRIVGRDLVDVKRFAGSPLRGAGPGSRVTWADYSPPLQPRAVLLLSDLGVGAPPLDDESALPGEWLRFVDEVTRAGCPVLALTPYPRARVQAALAQHIRTVLWDRSTTAAGVRRAVGGTLRVE